MTGHFMATIKIAQMCANDSRNCESLPPFDIGEHIVSEWRGKPNGSKECADIHDVPVRTAHGWIYRGHRPPANVVLRAMARHPMYAARIRHKQGIAFPGEYWG